MNVLSASDIGLLLGVSQPAISNWFKRGTGPLPAPAFPARAGRGGDLWTSEQIAPIAEEYRAKLRRQLEQMERAAAVLLK